MEVDLSPWAYISQEDWLNGGMYKAFNRENHQEIGRLGYINLWDKKILLISSLTTMKAYRHRLVATSLLEHMHLDYPEHLIDPGRRTVEAEGLYRYLKSTFPDIVIPVEAKEEVTT